MKDERLKPQYILAKHGISNKITYANFANRRNHYYRKFSCHQELSKAVMHNLEYGLNSIYKIKIRHKRCKGIPDAYDDYFALDLTYKCWKDRTKRRKQYYH